MRNHDQKIRDMSRSVLPSTARRVARTTRRALHRAERRDVRMVVAKGAEPARDWRGHIGDMVGERRAADKVAPLVRWAMHTIDRSDQLREASWHEQVDHFRSLLPDTTVGRHALAHIADAIEFRHADPPYRWYRRLATQPRPVRSIEPTVRFLYEAGYHRELNARLKSAGLPLLTGLGDIESFASGAGREARSIVLQLATDLHIP